MSDKTYKLRAALWALRIIALSIKQPIVWNSREFSVHEFADHVLAFLDEDADRIGIDHEEVHDIESQFFYFLYR